MHSQMHIAQAQVWREQKQYVADALISIEWMHSDSRIP